MGRLSLYFTAMGLKTFQLRSLTLKFNTHTLNKISPAIYNLFCLFVSFYYFWWFAIFLWYTYGGGGGDGIFHIIVQTRKKRNETKSTVKISVTVCHYISRLTQYGKNNISCIFILEQWIIHLLAKVHMMIVIFTLNYFCLFKYIIKL